MQEHTNSTKDAETVRARANPIHIVPTRQGANADLLRDVHMSLMRAEQNLYNLVQTTHTGTYAGHSPAYFAPAVPPGFASNATAYGLAQGNGISHAPSAPAFGSTPYQAFQAPVAPWWTPTSALPSAVAAGLSALSSALAAGIAALQTSTPMTWPATPWMPNRVPACDVADEGKAFVCRIDLPGLRPEDVEVLCLDQAVIINAVRETDGEALNLVQTDRATTWQRTIVLPGAIQPAATKANLTDGTLSVTLPKLNPTEGPRRIKVQG